MSEADSIPGARTSLRICFASGDRPHLFWTATESSRKLRYKILSKRLATGEIELLVIEQSGSQRRVLAHHRLTADLPSGWLSQWVDRLGRDLAVQFCCYDLRGIQNPLEWERVAIHLGWASRPSRPSGHTIR